MPIRDFRTLSTWMKLALVFLSLGVLLFVIGFATNSWMESRTYRYGRIYKGLWKDKECSGSRCRSYDNRYREDFEKATQAMECIGLIGMLMGFLLLLLYVCVDSCRRREAMLAIIFFLFGAVVAMVIGFVVYATKLEERGYQIGWSMGVAIGGCICTFIAAVMCVLHIQAR
ncbi:transmembrane protein 47-like [Babylonia areolata]|uniref:transmembrane protein 47-like n=1 Tax=Babylonia areolata TaxID=304850 RepID=UPI003FD48211